VDPVFPVAAVVAVAAVVLLALAELVARVAVARWRPCVVCPFPFLPAGAEVEWAAAVAVGVAVVVVAVAGVVAPRAGKGHLALYKVMGRVAVFAAVVGCPARFATLAWRRFAAVAVPVTLVLPV
jgi:hypothetical protein